MAGQNPIVNSADKCELSQLVWAAELRRGLYELIPLLALSHDYSRETDEEQNKVITAKCAYGSYYHFKRSSNYKDMLLFFSQKRIGDARIDIQAPCPNEEQNLFPLHRATIAPN